MKDVEGVLRGTCQACNGCDEYTLKEKSNQCDDCGCTVTRHKTMDGEARGRAGKSLLTDALEGTGENRYEFVASWVFYSVVVWSGLTVLLTMYTLSGANRGKAQSIFNKDEGVTFFNKMTFFGYCFGMAFSFFSYLGSGSAERRSLSLALFGIKFIAGMTYFLQWQKLTPAVMMPSGVPWLTSRSMEWMFCTPALMWVYRQITCAYDPMHNSLALDIVMVVTGWLGAIMKEPFATWMNTVSCLVYIPVIDHLMDMFQRAIERKTECRLDKQSLYMAKWIVWAAWWGMTVVYYLQRDKFVDFATGEALYFGCDMIAKVLFSFTVLMASTERV